MLAKEILSIGSSFLNSKMSSTNSVCAKILSRFGELQSNVCLEMVMQCVDTGMELEFSKKIQAGCVCAVC